MDDRKRLCFRVARSRAAGVCGHNARTHAHLHAKKWFGVNECYGDICQLTLQFAVRLE